MKTTPVIILALVVLLVVGGAMWFLTSSPDLVPLAPVPTPAPVFTSKAPDGGIVSVPRGSAPMPQENTDVLVSTTGTNPPEAERPLQEWEQRIETVLRLNATENETAQLLINMLPTLPPEGQAEAAQHVSNLVLDQDYNRVVPLVRNPSLPVEVHDVLFTDLMNREDRVKLPTLVEVAKLQNHPYHEEALTDLQIFLDQDHGNNWGEWEKSVKEYLKKQAAEDAAAAAAAPSEPAAPEPAPPAAPPAQ
jgi:hypothetical protein